MQLTLEQEVEEYLHPQARSRLRLDFPGGLEALYQLARLKARSRQVILTGLVAITLYDLFLFADYSKHPSVIWHCILLRLGLVTPMVLVTAWFVRQRARAAVRETLVLCSVTIAGGAVLAISYNLNRVDSIFSQTGFMLIVFFGSLILRQQFAYGAATMLLLLMEDALFLATDAWLTIDDKVTAVFMVSASILLALIANYMMERQERVSFAHSLNEGFHTKALARMNQQLTALSQVDGLTGLSNRRYFEERFKEMWHFAAENHQALSLIMIDIDHFKQLNDTFGHIAGDRVLVQMGQIMSSAVRTPDDLMARFGGEEFVILLADTDHDTAHQVAHDLRLLVYTSSFTPVNGEMRTPVTISCGLATIHPADGSERLNLIGEADLALYRAKSAGRNRVCCRACETLQPEQRWRPRSHAAGRPANGAVHGVHVRESMPSFLQS